MEKLAVIIGLLEQQEKWRICLPIVEIDGVKVTCFIEYEYKKKDKDIRFYVSVDCDNIDDIRYHKRGNGVTKDEILKFSQDLLEELPQLKLNIYGSFSIPNPISASIYSGLEDVFTSIECKTIKVKKIETCSVCYEKTITETPCKHLLCFRCWSQMKSEDDDEVPCPICRKCL